MKTPIANPKLMPTPVGKEMLSVGGSIPASTRHRPPLHTAQDVTGPDHLDEETLTRFRYFKKEGPAKPHRRE